MTLCTPLQSSTNDYTCVLASSCNAARTYVTVPGIGDVTPNGVLPNTSYGMFDAVGLGLTTINVVDSILYTYVPGRGAMTAAACAAAFRPTG